MRTTSMLFFIALTTMSFGPTQDHVTEDDERRVRQVLADYTDPWNKHDTEAFAAVFTQDVDYVNIAGRHWKGVEQNVTEHAKRFQTTLRNAVQTPTSVQIRFLRPDVVLVHTTWDVTG